MRSLAIRNVAIVVCLAAMADAAAQRPEDYTLIQRQVGRAAMEPSGDIGTLRLLCELSGHTAELIRGGADPQTVMDFLGECTVYQHRRYSEVFSPPDSMIARFPPESPWESLPLSATVLGGSDDAWSDGRVQAFGDARMGTGARMLVGRGESRAITIDLDGDGTPEVSGPVAALEIAEGLDCVTEVSADDSRRQWLIGAPGADLRCDPEIWVYCDGPVVFITLAPRAAGESVSAYGFCTQ
jgi:hypothetical protein